MAEKISGGNGMSGVLADDLMGRGKGYLDNDLIKFGGQRVPIDGVVIRRTDQNQNLHLVVFGKPVLLSLFKEHPPVEDLQKIAVKA